MVIAQALGEYGALAGLVSAITSTATAVENYVLQIEPSTWVAVGLVALLIWFIIGRVR